MGIVYYLYMYLFWRSVVVVLTIMAIYIIFPIFIVPSKLPAIQQNTPGDLQIYQLEIEPEPTFKNKFIELKKRHQTGINLIKARLQ